MNANLQFLQIIFISVFLDSGELNNVSLSKYIAMKYTEKNFLWEKEMNKKLSILHYLIAVGFFIIFIIRMLKSGFSSNVVWLCLGTANFCLGTFYFTRNKNDDNKENKE